MVLALDSKNPEILVAHSEAAQLMHPCFSNATVALASWRLLVLLSYPRFRANRGHRGHRCYFVVS